MELACFTIPSVGTVLWHASPYQLSVRYETSTVPNQSGTGSGPDTSSIPYQISQEPIRVRIPVSKTLVPYAQEIIYHAHFHLVDIL